MADDVTMLRRTFARTVLGAPHKVEDYALQRCCVASVVVKRHWELEDDDVRDACLLPLSHMALARHLSSVAGIPSQSTCVEQMRPAE